jgi:hypothetical protein
VTAVIRKNGRRGQATPPRRDDGALHAYAMFFDGDDRIAYADVLEDLLAVLIEGYPSMDEEDRLVARIRLAVRAQVWIQALINADVDPAVWNALSAEDRGVLTGSRHEQPRIDFWDPEIPLVLVETGYVPYTDVDQPISGIADVRYPPNMIWLRPVDEWDLLESLSEAGFVRLHQAVAP